MYKKGILGVILYICLAALLFPGPATQAVGVEDIGVRQFQDDFSEGMSLWKGVKGSWVVDNGALRVTTSSTNEIEPKGSNSVWQDQIVDFRIQIVGAPGRLQPVNVYADDGTSFIKRLLTHEATF